MTSSGITHLPRYASQARAAPYRDPSIDPEVFWFGGALVVVRMPDGRIVVDVVNVTIEGAERRSRMAKHRRSSRARWDAVEILLCRHDLQENHPPGSQSWLGAWSADANRLAREAIAAARRFAELGVEIEAAGLLIDGWTPGDPVERRPRRVEIATPDVCTAVHEAPREGGLRASPNLDRAVQYVAP